MADTGRHEVVRHDLGNLGRHQAWDRHTSIPQGPGTSQDQTDTGVIDVPWPIRADTRLFGMTSVISADIRRGTATPPFHKDPGRPRIRRTPASLTFHGRYGPTRGCSA